MIDTSRNNRLYTAGWDKKYTEPQPLILQWSDDAGQSWQRLSLGANDDDYHLNHIFCAPDGSLFIAAEGGNAYRSRDNGVTWEALDTGVSGSLWSGITLRDGRVLLAGMSGRVLLSEDRGDSWRELDIGSQQAITAVIQLLT